jgi:hypothetical protein
MALVGLLPNGGLSILWLFHKVRLSKRKETHLEREHLLFHSKVKPLELHHHTLWPKSGITPVATPLWVKCEGEVHTPKSGKLESYGTPENLELDCRGQISSHLNS